MKNHSTFKVIIFLTGLLISLYLLPAQANMRGAYQAYQQKNYNEAFKYFQQSAHLGLTDAQLKVAGFYAKGLGVEPDAVMSYVYIALAADHGNKKAKSNVSKSLSMLTPEQQVNAKQLWQQYKNQYGYAALNKKALPRLLASEVRHRPVRRLSGGNRVGPSIHAVRKSDLASAIVEFDIGADGKVRDIEVDKSYYMDGSNVDSIVASTSRAKFRAAKTVGIDKHTITSYGHRSIWTQTRLSEYYVKTELPKFHRLMKSLRKSAEQGNAYDQYRMAMMILVFPSLETNRVRYVDYIEKSAKAAIPEAELEYAKLLLRGKLVTKNSSQAIDYLLHAAQVGYARAQYKLARQFLSGRVVDKDENKAMFWLKQAAERDEPYAKYWLSRLYLTSDDQQLRNPALAQELLETVAEQQRDNPNWHYYASIADIALGNKKSARQLLADAIEKAEDLSWNLTEFQQLAATL